MQQRLYPRSLNRSVSRLVHSQFVRSKLGRVLSAQPLLLFTLLLAPLLSGVVREHLLFLALGLIVEGFLLHAFRLFESPLHSPFFLQWRHYIRSITSCLCGASAPSQPSHAPFYAVAPCARRLVSSAFSAPLRAHGRGRPSLSTAASPLRQPARSPLELLLASLTLWCLSLASFAQRSQMCHRCRTNHCHRSLARLALLAPYA